MEAVLKYFKPSSISMTAKLFAGQFATANTEELTEAFEGILEEMYTKYVTPNFVKQNYLFKDVQKKSADFVIAKLKDSTNDGLDAEAESDTIPKIIADMFEHFIIPMSNVCSALQSNDKEQSKASASSMEVEYGSVIKEAKPVRRNIRVEAWNEWKANNDNITKKYTDDNGTEMTAHNYWDKNIWSKQKEEIVSKKAEEPVEKKPRGRPKKVQTDDDSKPKPKPAKAGGSKKAPIVVAEENDDAKESESDSAKESESDDAKESKSDDAKENGKAAVKESAKTKVVASKKTERAARAVSAFELFQQQNKEHIKDKESFIDPENQKKVSGYELSRKIWSANFKKDEDLAKPYNTTAEEIKKGVNQKQKTYQNLPHLDWDFIRSDKFEFQNGKYTIELID